MKTKADETSNLSHMQIHIIGIAQKQNEEHNRKRTLTGIPVTIEAKKVPKIANITMAPKLEKKGFCQENKIMTRQVAPEQLEF